MRIAVFIFASLLFAVIASAQSEVKTPESPNVPRASTNMNPKPVPAKAPVAKAPPASDIKTLVIEDLTVGKGKVAQKGKSVKVHYTGWLYDPAQPNGRGKQFDSSIKRGEPFTFPLGASQVIKGWDEGFKDMKAGGKRRLIIPADMGYGAAGARGVIPPNAALLFEVELIDVLDASI